MKCPSCQFENPETKKFCRKCGSKLLLACPKCGAEILPDDDFCGDCGHNLKEIKKAPPLDYSKPQSYTPKFLADKILTTRSAMEGERKLVTAFFADVANYTSISEKLDPEEVHQIMDGFFKILMDEIHKYEGTINQFTGDGVMALFGAPVAHEDHAQRACYSALSIQKAMKEYGSKVKKDTGVEFKIRIGINSGPVIVGAIGDDLRMDYTAVGDTTNLAARIQQSARAGEVWISRETQNIIRGFFQVDSVGDLELKGKAEPQPAYRVMSEHKEIRTRFEAGLTKGVTELVGRRPEMESLKTAWERAKSGEAQLVDIVGEAGVGKSRLAYEFQNTISDEGTILTGICIHYGRNINFLPLIDIVKGAFGIQEGMSEEEAGKRIEDKAVGDLKSMIPFYRNLLSLKVDDPKFNALNPEGRKFGTFEAVKNLILSLSEDRPLVVFLEDVHWIDKISEEFFVFFSHSIHGKRILVLTAYRPEASPGWAKGPHYRHLGVETLSEKSSGRLVRNILGGVELDPELEKVIVAKTGGNPFFVEEMVRELLGRDELIQEGDRYISRKPIDRLDIPGTVQGVLAARMDRLSEDLKRTMQVASVIGRDFAFKILRSIMALGDELRTHLTNLVGLEILYEKALYPELEYIFKHALTQEVAYESLLKQKRREIHGRIGQTIEELYADRLEEHYETLAYHYELSGETDKTLSYLVLAGEKANRNMAIHSANEFFSKAIQIGEMNPERFSPEEMAKSYLGKGTALWAIGDWNDMISVFRKCIKVSREHGLVDFEFMSLRLISNYSILIESEQEADDILDDVLNRACYFENYSLESTALTARATRIAFQNPKIGHEGILKSQEIALKSGDLVAIGYAMMLRAFIERWLGQPAKTIETTEGIIETFTNQYEYIGVLYTIFLRGVALAEMGRISEAIELIERGIDMSLRSGGTIRLSTLYNCLGYCYSEICLPENAWGHNKKSEDISGDQMMKSPYAIRQFAEINAQAKVNLMENLFDQGRMDEAWNLMHSVKAQTKSADFDMARIHWETRMRHLEARILMQMGDLDQAEKLIHANLESSDEKGMQKRFGGFLRLLGEIQVKRGQPEKAVETLNRSVETLKRGGNHRQIWMAHTSLASAYRMLGRVSEEREQWHAAKLSVEAMAKGIYDENLKKAFLNTAPIIEIFINASR